MSLCGHISLKIFVPIALLSALLYICYPVGSFQHSTDAPSDISFNSTFTNIDESESGTDIASPNSSQKESQMIKRIAVPEQYASERADVRLIYTFGDLEADLCGEKHSWADKAVYRPVEKPCPRQGIVSYIIGGRTGNQMWKYSTIWAIARYTGLHPYLPKCLKDELERVFEELSMPTMKEISHCPIEYNTFVKSSAEWQHPSQNIILVTYNFHKTLVLRWLGNVVQEFKFRKEIRDRVQEILEDFVKTRPPKQYTFVAVHVRRADYIRYLKKKYGERTVDPSFFRNAMDYFRNKYPNCLFIYVSDDPTWCFENFGQMEDVYVASYAKNTTAAEDLAMMAACNHTIFDYGTFGQWGSILAGGETVYSSMERNFSNGTMSNWIMMEE